MAKMHTLSEFSLSQKPTRQMNKAKLHEIVHS